MKRRAFISLLAGAAAWPLAARAQQAAMPVIGCLDGGGQLPPISLAAFYTGLNDVGYVDGRNVAIEYRTAAQYDQLRALAADLVRRQVAVIFATGAVNSSLAAKAATATIPVVFASGSDPVAVGLVASLSRPGANVTGVSFYTNTLLPKRLELMQGLIPQVTTIGFLTNPTNVLSETNMLVVQAAASSVGQQVIVLKASGADEINSAFATAARLMVRVLLVDVDGLFPRSPFRGQIVALAARYGIAVSYTNRQYVEDGGLMSYGDDRRESYRQAGIYVGRILKGEKPADLPVLQPTKFEFVINLKTAKALGLEIPDKLLALADEVIE